MFQNVLFGLVRQAIEYKTFIIFLPFTEIDFQGMLVPFQKCSWVTTIIIFYFIDMNHVRYILGYRYCMNVMLQ